MPQTNNAMMVTFLHSEIIIRLMQYDLMLYVRRTHRNIYFDFVLLLVDHRKDTNNEINVKKQKSATVSFFLGNNPT